MDEATIDFLILANHVEAVNGLLYISGGGWTEYRRQVKADQPLPTMPLSLGLSVCVPWTETNRPQRLVVRVENQDSTVVLAKVEAELNVGRPPTLPVGAEQHTGVAITLPMTFPAPGEYRVIADLNDGRAMKRWPFRIYDIVSQEVWLSPLQSVSPTWMSQ